jgi:hypothetical protein
MELATADRELEIVLLRVLRKARKGLVWRDRVMLRMARLVTAGLGVVWHGLATVDRVLATVPLRVLGTIGERLGTTMRGTARRGLDWFGVG